MNDSVDPGVSSDTDQRVATIVDDEMVGYELKIGDQTVVTSDRAIVMVDAKSFSITSNQIQSKVGTSEVVLIYQQIIKDYVKRRVIEFKNKGSEVWYQFTGGDAAILMFMTSTDAHEFVSFLNCNADRRRLLFSAGGAYGQVSYYVNSEDPSVLDEIGGFPVSLAARLQSCSQAGRLMVNRDFHDQLDVLYQANSSSQAGNHQHSESKRKLPRFQHFGEIEWAKNTHIGPSYNCDYIDDIRLISDTASITLKPGTVFDKTDWPTLWKLLMGGTLFLTMNRMAAANWVQQENGNIVIADDQKMRIGIMGLINEIYGRFTHPFLGDGDMERACRIFIYDDDGEREALRPAIDFHKKRGIAVRTLKLDTFNDIMREASIFHRGVFSISQVDDYFFVALYSFSEAREIESIVIPRLNQTQIARYFDVYKRLLEGSDTQEQSNPEDIHVN